MNKLVFTYFCKIFECVEFYISQRDAVGKVSADFITEIVLNPFEFVQVLLSADGHLIKLGRTWKDFYTLLQLCCFIRIATLKAIWRRL